MAKRVLMMATVPSMIGQFNMNNIQILLDMGYQVDVAADFTDTSVWPHERVQKFKDQMKEMDIECIQLNFSRGPLKFGRHIGSYKETVKLIQDRQYSFIHTHTPIASAIVRLAAKKTKTKVIYTAHGFHFYDGAPLKNWLLYYPIEKWLSRYTDVLITINKEDYKRAMEKFKAKKTVYIPGVGVDTEKFGTKKENNIHEELGIPVDATILLSVGELNENKNHESVIRALAEIQEVKAGKIFYLIVGQGDLKEKLQGIIHMFGLDKQVKLLGFRNDVVDLYDAADIFVFSSYREGLSVALMEAMASGLPVACGKIRGNMDLIDEKDGTLFKPDSITDIQDKIEYLLQKSKKELERFGQNNLTKIRRFDKLVVQKTIKDVYETIPEIGGGARQYIGCEHLMVVLHQGMIRTSLNCEVDELMILSVGELSRRKNHQIVIRALAAIMKEKEISHAVRQQSGNSSISFKYYIAGTGALEQELQKLINELGLSDSIKLLGFRSDIKQLLDTADLFVFPSLQEGLPVALMEAMACGLPVLCSNIRGNVDLIDNRKHLFDPKDVNDLKDKLRLRRKLSKRELSDLGKRYLETMNEFSKEVVLEKMRKIYSADCV